MTFTTEQLTTLIVEHLRPINANKIILFGSYAYGNPTDESDLDICVIEDDYTSKYQEKKRIRELLKDIDLPKDIIVEKQEFFDTHSTDEWINTALYDIRNFGTVIYEKG